MWDLITNSAGLLGGITGLGGAIFTHLLPLIKGHFDLKRQLKLAEVTGKNQAFIEAIKAESSISQTNMSQWANDVRGLFRPGLTTLLVSAYIYGTVILKLDRIDLVGLEYMTATSVMFWFGSRQIDKGVNR